MSVTGTGAKDSPYIVETYDEMIEYVKKPGVYVKLSSTNIFDLDEIYKNKDIPNGIEIGNYTELDGNGSSIISTRLTAEDFDFEGANARIINFKTLSYKESNPCENLLLFNNAVDFLNEVSDNTQIPYNNRHRLKCTVKNLLIDLKNESFSRTMYFTGRVLQANNLIISGHKDIQFLTKSDSGNTNNVYIYDINIVDCECIDRQMFSGSNKGILYFYDFKNIKCYLNTSSLISINNYVNFYNGNLTLYGNGKAQLNSNGSLISNCNVYLNNMALPNFGSFDTCYIFGENITSNTVDGTSPVTKCIIEIKNNNSQFPSGTKINNTVVNCSDGYYSDGGTRTGVTFLTTEEIRNPQKLYSAGIPIDPTGAAG